MSSWKEHAEVWKAMPRASQALFYAGVFCLFGSLALIISSMQLKAQRPVEVGLLVLVSGGFAMLWAYCGIRRMIWMFFVIPFLQGAANTLVESIYTSGQSLASNPQALRHKLIVDGGVAIALIAIGYALFIAFFNREGDRFFKAHAEMKMAKEIHKSLVRAVDRRIGGFELYGASVPSGAMGGDLLDVVEHDGRWYAYVADVSGHGVPAGILMAMIMSAARMRLTKGDSSGDLLSDLNDVLQPFTKPASFLTFAYVGFSGSDALTFSLAGHLPLLHYDRAKKIVSEHTTPNFPLGMFPNQIFAAGKLSMVAGDVLISLTDGFTEVFNAEEHELGLDSLKYMLLANAEKPLAQIFEQIRKETFLYGKQSDDQTMLLIRRLE